MLATVVIIIGVAALAVPGSSAFASEFLVLLGAFEAKAAVGVIASLAVILAAMYMLRWISAILHDREGDAVGASNPPELRGGGFFAVIPLVAAVLALSFYPHAVTKRVDAAASQLAVAGRRRGREVNTPSVQWSALAPDLILIGGAAFLLLAAVHRPGPPRARPRDVRRHGLLHRLAGRGRRDLGLRRRLVERARGPVRRRPVREPRPRDRRGSGLLALMGAYGWSRLREHGPEFVAFLLVAAAGMDLLAASNSFISLFVTLETFSIALYALCAFETRSSASLEAGLKYLVLGSIGSAILLYGAAFLYGATGSFGFPEIAKGVAEDPNSLLALAGTALVLAGLGFKIAVVPFHMWTPDVYEGSPTPVTAFMSAATKAAAFAALFRVLVQALPAMGDVWRPAPSRRRRSSRCCSPTSRRCGRRT